VRGFLRRIGGVSGFFSTGGADSADTEFNVVGTESYGIGRDGQRLGKIEVYDGTAFSANQMTMIACNAIETSICDFVHSVNQPPFGKLHHNPKNTFTGNRRDFLFHICPDFINRRMRSIAADVPIDSKTLNRASAVVNIADLSEPVDCFFGHHDETRERAGIPDDLTSKIPEKDSLLKMVFNKR